MSWRLWFVALLLVVTILAGTRGASAADAPLAADVVLRGGTIWDGTGGASIEGDVAIHVGKIVAVGPKLATVETAREIDCRGLAIAPGFIDLHNHSDDAIVSSSTRANVNFLTQGCTTIVTGNCGSGPVDVAGYLRKIDAAGAGTHVIHLLPHGSLRAQVMGRDARKPTPDELERMKSLAAQAMDDGAWGMSTGLIYVPGNFAETEELIELARVVGKSGGIYASHIRNEGAALRDSLDEILRIGRESGAAVHVSHIKASGKDAWGTMRLALAMLDIARGEGQRVTADQYPYVASSTSLEATLLPAWSREGGRTRLRERLDNSETAAQIRADVSRSLTTKGRIQLASCSWKPAWVGRSLDEIAKAEGREIADIVLDLERNGGARVVHFGMSEEDVRLAMTADWVATASDGGAKIPDGDKPHPRSFGTFPRKIGFYAVREKTVTLAQAIRSASGLPADILGLQDRGYVRPGLVADLVVFAPDQLLDRATFDNPYAYSTGVRHVFVRGRPAIHDGVPTGALAGRALRKK